MREILIETFLLHLQSNTEDLNHLKYRRSDNKRIPKYLHYPQIHKTSFNSILIYLLYFFNSSFSKFSLRKKKISLSKMTHIRYPSLAYLTFNFNTSFAQIGLQLYKQCDGLNKKNCRVNGVIYSVSFV